MKNKGMQELQEYYLTISHTVLISHSQKKQDLWVMTIPDLLIDSR